MVGLELVDDPIVNCSVSTDPELGFNTTRRRIATNVPGCPAFGDPELVRRCRRIQKALLSALVVGCGSSAPKTKTTGGEAIIEVPFVKLSNPSFLSEYENRTVSTDALILGAGFRWRLRVTIDTVYVT